MLSSNMQISHGDLDILTCRKIIRQYRYTVNSQLFGIAGYRSNENTEF
jgi:hypothetical protein